MINLKGIATRMVAEYNSAEADRGREAGEAHRKMVEREKGRAAKWAVDAMLDAREAILQAAGEGKREVDITIEKFESDISERTAQRTAALKVLLEDQEFSVDPLRIYTAPCCSNSPFDDRVWSTLLKVKW